MLTIGDSIVIVFVVTFVWFMLIGQFRMFPAIETKTTAGGVTVEYKGSSTDELPGIFQSARNILDASKKSEDDATIATLSEALQRMINASSEEFLYQTGQTVRPEKEYPDRGTVCGELYESASHARDVLNSIKSDQHSVPSPN